MGKGQGKLRLLGMVEEEEINLRSRKLRRKGTALASAQNAALCFMTRFGLDISDYDITFNVPGGIPMDGPSAGIALCVALMSAITLKPPIPMLAMTGEITSRGEVKPVGGVREKLAEQGARVRRMLSAFPYARIYNRRLIQQLRERSEAVRAEIRRKEQAIREESEQREARIRMAMKKLRAEHKAGKR